jgi:hypothetical protein
MSLFVDLNNFKVCSVITDLNIIAIARWHSALVCRELSSIGMLEPQIVFKNYIVVTFISEYSIVGLALPIETAANCEVCDVVFQSLSCESI